MNLPEVDHPLEPHISRRVGYVLGLRGGGIAVVVSSVERGKRYVDWSTEEELRSKATVDREDSGEAFLKDLRGEQPSRYHLYRLGMDELLYRRTT